MSGVANEVIVVRGTKPTEEETGEIKAMRRKEIVLACKIKREEKWLTLSKKEVLTPEEQEWMDKIAHNKKGVDCKARRQKWLLLKSKDLLTDEEKEWLEKENARMEDARRRSKEVSRLRREKWLMLSTKDTLAPKEEEWLKKEKLRRATVKERAATNQREKDGKGKTRARRRAVKEKRLFLSSKEVLTEEEGEWLENEKQVRERHAERLLVWREKNAEYVREYQECWYQENKEEVSRKNRESRASMTREERDVLNKKAAAWSKKKRAEDPTFAYLCSTRSRMSGLLHGIEKSGNPRSTDRFEAYFGCDKKTFISHIESQFRDGMTWENRGKLWELDHIVPLGAGLGNPELLVKLNHYHNLQPLTREENRKKWHSLPEIWPQGVPFTREEALESLSKRNLKGMSMENLCPNWLKEV